jgi:hypothetical protein
MSLRHASRQTFAAARISLDACGAVGMCVEMMFMYDSVSNARLCESAA